MMEAGDWHGALRMAAGFGRLGEEKEPITRAWAAIQNPGFYRQIGKDPAALEAAGIAALKAKYLRPAKDAKAPKKARQAAQ